MSKGTFLIVDIEPEKKVFLQLFFSYLVLVIFMSNDPLNSCSYHVPLTSEAMPAFIAVLLYVVVIKGRITASPHILLPNITGAMM